VPKLLTQCEKEKKKRKKTLLQREYKHRRPLTVYQNTHTHTAAVDGGRAILSDPHSRSSKLSISIEARLSYNRNMSLPWSKIYLPALSGYPSVLRHLYAINGLIVASGVHAPNEQSKQNTQKANILNMI
jgi:hypothetical protein